ncbi:hypothetical protein TRAPUB_12122 [Trametes pubescens]|uniref:CxC1-like cysteine cluster associated with KDZ transposases domain-containing protein n=1 Tax=Trametes pubescens TaxID=154538 RepID=A0A1M2VUR9_TRAPU|nr:hypothetical protein TRAPUB_12122 [Trametes pubescens]
MKRKRTSRRVVWASRPDPPDPLQAGVSSFAPYKTYTSKKYSHITMTQEKEQLNERHSKNMFSLGNSQREMLQQFKSDTSSVQPASSSQQEDVHMDTGDDDRSNAADWFYVDGDEEDTIQIRDILSMRSRQYRAKDDRSWGHRIQSMDDNWRPLLPRLVSAFLRWQHTPSPLSSNDAGLANPDGDAPSFTIDVLDFHTLARTATVPTPSDCETHAEALVLSGYLGTVPLRPSLAISLKTLELFRCIRLFKASFSVEAFAKLMCHYYSVPYRRTYRSALSDVFDIYLHITREVEAGVTHALGRDTLNWRVLHACPPCGYKLHKEPDLMFMRLYAMDGNNSLKHLVPLGGRRAGDDRVFDGSDYFLPKVFVDKYTNEVRSRPPPPSAEEDDDADVVEPHTRPSVHDPDKEEGDPTDGSAVISSCTKNWKAAAVEEKKRAWGIFDETGIFASTCRHGLILWLVDMVRSGELAKYPLSIVAKVLDVLDAPTLCGFDIGCTFEGTVKSSSLGEAFTKSASRCQLRNHPIIFRGIGLEDLEVMERIFSTSNHLAAVVRYASGYRRRVLIDAFFCHWDNKKYQNLGLMLYNNYRQALEIIEGMTVELTNTLASLNITADHLKSYREEKLRYFEQLGEELPEDLHAIAYVEALQELNSVSAEMGDAEEHFLSTVPPDYAPSDSVTFLPPVNTSTTYAADASATRKAETRRRFLRDRYKALSLEVTVLEVKMGIIHQWQPGDPQYIKVMDYIATRKYQRALGHLQRLVVQRLFELHRLNLAQTGTSAPKFADQYSLSTTAYRVRTHIAKHLQARCKAIRTAVNNYNTAATALKPPQPPLDWSQVSHMRFVEEFELLQDTRGDLRDKPWRQPVIRETMRIAHCVERAREEIQRLNVEVRRLHTAIRDEDELFDVVLDDLALRRDPWHGPVLEHATRRRRVNARVLAYIDKIYELPGFTGTPSAGQQAGAVFPALVSQSVLIARATVPATTSTRAFSYPSTPVSPTTATSMSTASTSTAMVSTPFVSVSPSPATSTCAVSDPAASTSTASMSAAAMSAAAMSAASMSAATTSAAATSAPSTPATPVVHATPTLPMPASSAGSMSASTSTSKVAPPIYSMTTFGTHSAVALCADSVTTSHGDSTTASRTDSATASHTDSATASHAAEPSLSTTASLAASNTPTVLTYDVARLSTPAAHYSPLRFELPLVPTPVETSTPFAMVATLPSLPSPDTDILALEHLEISHEEETAAAEDILEEQATAYADFVASMV